MSEEINNEFWQIEDYKPLIDELPENCTDQDIRDILNKIPKQGSTILARRVIDLIIEKTNLGRQDLKKIYKEIQEEQQEEIQQEQENIIIANTPDTETIDFDEDKIIITNNKIYLFNNYVPHTITDFKIEVISKVLDIRKEEELFTFKIGGIIRSSYDINGILNLLGKRVYRGTKGGNVIAHLIEEKAKNLSLKEAVYIPGWNNGWYTPMDEEEKDFTVIHYSDEQRTAYNNCRNMYKDYKIEEKEALKNKLNKFVKLTDMPEAYKAITIGLSLMVPFRLYFIEKFGIFPHLALYGRTTAGKTHWLDFWTTHFTKHRLKHMSGSTASSPTRIEGAMTGGTWAVMVDDYKETNSYNTSQMEMLLKDSATGTPLRKRLRRDGVTFIDNREVVSSVFTTSQDLGNLFLRPALLARTVSLYHDKSISPNVDWISLELDLIQENLFSILYDYTKDWTDKHLDKLIKIVEKIYHNYLKYINPRTADMLYPKLLRIYKIILAGCLIAKKYYGIELEVKDIWKILIESRRTAIKEFISIFLGYCNWAIHLDPAKPIPRYLTTQLEYNSVLKRFIFQITNLRDFNTHYAGYTNDRIKFKMTSLEEILFEALEYKELVELKRQVMHNTKNVYAILIHPVLIHVGDEEPTKESETIAHHRTLEEAKLIKRSKMTDKERQEENKKIASGELVATEKDIDDLNSLEDETVKFNPV